MAGNSECFIIVLDVRCCADENFKLNSQKCVREILKDRICAGKKCYVSFVLVGTEKTSNDVNTNMFHDSYLNIVQYPHVQAVTWQLFMNFFDFVKLDPCDEGDWLDGLVVARQLLESSGENFKFEHKRIVLFYDFNDSPNNYDMFDIITKNFVESQIDLIVVSHNIQYISDGSSEARPIFSDAAKGKHQLDTEKYVLKLVQNCNAKLCNFNEALHDISKIENKKPWVWNSTLRISTKICIRVSGIIAIKDESRIKLKKCWGEKEENVSRELKSFVGGGQVDVLDEDLIDGYMLGGTPVPYDEILNEEREQYQRGLQLIACTKRNSIPEEYFCGDSLYWVVHQKGMSVSAVKLDALVKALMRTEMVLLCWKVFSPKFNAPKLVVLLPNEFVADKLASLTMVELSYNAQHHFFDFPSLRTPKTECTEKQLQAIDDLIDAMDLTLSPKELQFPRDNYQQDLLPFDSLQHVYEKNIMDILERKVVMNATEEDDISPEMLEEKDFVGRFWKVPEIREEGAKAAANALKKLFLLEDTSKN